jgi:xylulokinase
MARPEIAGIAVTSTSGTLVLAGAGGDPVRPAILYDDGRSAEIGAGLGLNASYSLAKAAWVKQHEPRAWEKACYILHPADWLAGRLTGEFGISDHSNALKLGYDPETGTWTEVVRAAGMPAERLPRVVGPGRQIGSLSRHAAFETGLPAGTRVFAGATDGMAGLIASGASCPGDANTTLGSTLVWKALCSGRPRAVHGIYCHLHPSGLWAPGAASNTGPGILRTGDAETGEAERDALAVGCLPCPTVGYFLPAPGKRFPFLNPRASTFMDGAADTAAGRHAVRLQSLACVERWGYERWEGCGIMIGRTVFSTGGAARSAVYSSLRASVLNRCVALARDPCSAFGAAVLAASGACFSDGPGIAVRAMTSVSATFEPEADLTARYQEIYGSFREACARWGYGP